MLRVLQITFSDWAKLVKSKYRIKTIFYMKLFCGIEEVLIGSIFVDIISYNNYGYK